MPQEGTYIIEKVDEAWFVKQIKLAHECNRLKSSIGYPQNIKYIKKISGVDVALSREPTVLKDGDWMLIMRLPYRPKDTTIKNRNFKKVKMEFEYFICEYSEPFNDQDLPS